MECNVPTLVRGGGIENSDQIPNPIEINPITNPLQVLENWLWMDLCRKGKLKVWISVERESFSLFLGIWVTMKCERNRINFPGKCGIYFSRKKKKEKKKWDLDVWSGWRGRWSEVQSWESAKRERVWEDFCFGGTLSILDLYFRKKTMLQQKCYRQDISRLHFHYFTIGIGGYGKINYLFFFYLGEKWENILRLLLVIIDLS